MCGERVHQTLWREGMLEGCYCVYEEECNNSRIYTHGSEGVFNYLGQLFSLTP